MRIKRNSKGWRALRTLARRLSGPATQEPRNAKQLTSEEIATILRANEFSREIEGCPVIRGYSTNCLAANVNMEDRSAEAKLLASEGPDDGEINPPKRWHNLVLLFEPQHLHNYEMNNVGYIIVFTHTSKLPFYSATFKHIYKSRSLFAVYDGHAGHICAEVLMNKLFHYIATALLPDASRDRLFHSQIHSDSMLTERYRESGTGLLPDQIHDVFEELRIDWLDKLKRTKQIFTREECLTKAFQRMDADIGKAAERTTKTKDMIGPTMMEAAMSGAVACVALIEGRDLYVAGTGDCGAVLGRQKENGTWAAVKLNNEHTAANSKEVAPLRSEHPKDERKSIIQRGRLFGSLMPLRAFGDFRYKWPVDVLERIVVPTYGRQVISANYRTPPYLTANPEVVHRKITPEDKFLVLATDGLWDVLSPEMVVQLVGDHRNRLSSKLKIKKSPDVLPRLTVQEMITISPSESFKNPSTYLLLAALGGSIERVNQQLAVPLGEARNIRDDITVTVLFFNSDAMTDTNSYRKNSTQNISPTDMKSDPKESESSKVNEPTKDKGGSMAHSTKWEDIETAGTDDQAPRLTDEVDLETALGSGGIIKSKTFKTTVSPRKTRDTAPEEA